MKERSESNSAVQISKGVSTGLIFTLIAILIFAFVLKVFNLDSGIIKPVNQFIKIIGIFLGCYFSLSGKAGFLKGIAVGFITTILTYLLFSLFTNSIDFNAMLALDLLLGCVVGLISGVIAVNLNK